MLPKAFKLGRKGFTISPFFLIAMVLLGALLISHFQQTDQSKQKQIMDAGEKNKQYLEVEESAAKLQTLLMFVSNQAVYEENEDLKKIITLAQASNADLTTVLGSDAIKSRLEKKITAALNKESGTTFTVKIDNSNPNEGFTVTATGGQLDSPNGKVPVTLEKFVNARIFLLASKLLELRTNFMDPLGKDLSCKFNAGTYAKSATCKPATLQYDSKKRSGPGVYCNIIAKPNTILPDMPNYNIATDFRDPSYDLTRIQDAIVNTAKAIAIENNKQNDGIAASYQIVKINTVINPTFTEFQDPLAAAYSHCCHTTPAVAAKKNKDGTITPGVKAFCDKPDHDYRGYVEINAEIVIQAKFSDHAKIADATGGNLKICTTSPIMVNTGKIYPLELSYEFTVPVVIRIDNLFLECKSSIPLQKSTSKSTGFPVYIIDSKTPPYSPDPVICGSSIIVKTKYCLPYVLAPDRSYCNCGG